MSQRTHSESLLRSLEPRAFFDFLDFFDFFLRGSGVQLVSVVGSRRRFALRRPRDSSAVSNERRRLGKERENYVQRR
jgi:hypothetical protein